MKAILTAGLMLASVAASHAANSVTPWMPIFKGIDQGQGTNNGVSIQLSVHAVRVDLQDPDVHLLVTPPVTNNYIPGSRETFLQTPREFMAAHGLKVAVNGCYFAPGGYQYPSGTPASVEGTVLSKGQLVSVQSSSNNSQSALLFTSNNVPTFLPYNWPAPDTSDAYNAMSGLYPLLINGVNVAYAYTNNLFGIHGRQPRTAMGLSQDNRYLIFITIDGRQSDTDGAYDYETAEFLLLFGAWNAMNVDGGGSTCMVKANDCGAAVDINENSFQYAVSNPGSQRPVGANFGVYAATLPRALDNVQVTPGTTTAILTWDTDVPATTQVEYGLTTNYSNATPLDARLLRRHVATISGLSGGTTYQFRALSSDGSVTHTFACTLTTTSSTTRTLVFGLTNAWKFITNNLDGVNWTANNYDDSGWSAPSPGCLHIENSTSGGIQFAPRNTLLPPGFVVPIMRTYYFRTPFNVQGSTTGLSLTFSNYVDDGAAFYLNGSELTRFRVPAGATYATAASGGPCVGTQFGGDAATICPDVFTVPATNLVQGTNVVAVEVHNVSGGTTTQDIFFGSALFLNAPGNTVPRLFIVSENGQSTIYWNGQGFILQRSTNLSSPANWTDVPGPISQSPAVLSEVGSVFYRLRN